MRSGIILDSPARHSKSAPRCCKSERKDKDKDKDKGVGEGGGEGVGEAVRDRCTMHTHSLGPVADDTRPLGIKHSPQRLFQPDARLHLSYNQSLPGSPRYAVPATAACGSRRAVHY